MLVSSAELCSINLILYFLKTYWQILYLVTLQLSVNWDINAQRIVTSKTYKR